MFDTLRARLSSLVATGSLDQIKQGFDWDVLNTSNLTADQRVYVWKEMVSATLGERNRRFVREEFFPWVNNYLPVSNFSVWDMVFPHFDWRAAHWPTALVELIDLGVRLEPGLLVYMCHYTTRIHKWTAEYTRLVCRLLDAGQESLEREVDAEPDEDSSISQAWAHVAFLCEFRRRTRQSSIALMCALRRSGLASKDVARLCGQTLWVLRFVHANQCSCKKCVPK